jgi:DNA-binding transcriptional MerR regulator
LVVPSIAEAKGTGTERLYSFKDLVALRVARDLRAAGISTKALRTAIGNIQNLPDPLAESRILAIGSSVVWVAGCQEIIDVLKKPGQGLFQFMLDFPRAVKETKHNVDRIRAA